MVSRIFSGVTGSHKSLGTVLALATFVVALGKSVALTAQAASQPPAHSLSAAKTAIPAPIGASGQNYVFLSPAKGEESEESEARPSDAEHQNIKMHGHWVIDIKNPDGTIADHRDFHNSIQLGGQEFLLALMAGYWVPSDYDIFLEPATGATGPCTPPTGGSAGCIIVRSLTTQPGIADCGAGGYYCATGLTTTYNLSYTTNSSMVLAGSVTATQAGTISYVATISGECGNSASPNANPPSTVSNVSPASCTATPASEANFLNEISFAELSNAPISVLNGQIIQVTVTISFS